MFAQITEDSATRSRGRGRGRDTTQVSVRHLAAIFHWGIDLSNFVARLVSGPLKLSNSVGFG